MISTSKKICISASVLLFLAVCFATEGWFGSSFVRLGNGVQMNSSLDMAVFEGGATGFFVDITNSAVESSILRLSIVPQVTTADGVGNSGCDMVNGGVFSSYFTGNYDAFTLAGGETQRKRVDFIFPGCLSGVYQGCVVHSPLNDMNLGDADLVLGKANFVRFAISPSSSCVPLSIKVFPGSRPGGDYTNIGELRFYTINKQFVSSGIFQTNILGSVNLEQGVSPGIYYVVYKGQSHLASYLSGVQVIDGQSLVLDFTTGSNLYNIQNKSISQDDGNKYQIAGDMKSPLSSQYDFVVNGNDVSSLVYGSGLVEGGVSILDPKNLNGDLSINGADIAIIGINYQQVDPFADNVLFPR